MIPAMPRALAVHAVSPPGLVGNTPFVRRCPNDVAPVLSGNRGHKAIAGSTRFVLPVTREYCLEMGGEISGGGKARPMDSGKHLRAHQIG